MNRLGPVLPRLTPEQLADPHTDININGFTVQLWQVAHLYGVNHDVPETPCPGLSSSNFRTMRPGQQDGAAASASSRAATATARLVSEAQLFHNPLNTQPSALRSQTRENRPPNHEAKESGAAVTSAAREHLCSPHRAFGEAWLRRGAGTAPRERATAQTSSAWPMAEVPTASRYRPTPINPLQIPPLLSSPPLWVDSSFPPPALPPPSRSLPPVPPRPVRGNLLSNRVAREASRPVQDNPSHTVGGDLSRRVGVDTSRPVRDGSLYPARSDSLRPVEFNASRPLGGSYSRPFAGPLLLSHGAHSRPAGGDGQRLVEGEPSWPPREHPFGRAGGGPSRPSADNPSHPLGSRIPRPARGYTGSAIRSDSSRPLRGDDSNPTPDLPRPARSDTVHPFGGDSSRPLGRKTEPLPPRGSESHALERNQAGRAWGNLPGPARDNALHPVGGGPPRETYGAPNLGMRGAAAHPPRLFHLPIGASPRYRIASPNRESEQTTNATATCPPFDARPPARGASSTAAPPRAQELRARGRETSTRVQEPSAGAREPWKESPALPTRPREPSAKGAETKVEHTQQRGAATGVIGGFPAPGPLRAEREGTSQGQHRTGRTGAWPLQPAGPFQPPPCLPPTGKPPGASQEDFQGRVLWNPPAVLQQTHGFLQHPPPGPTQLDLGTTPKRPWLSSSKKAKSSLNLRAQETRPVTPTPTPAEDDPGLKSRWSPDSSPEKSRMRRVRKVFSLAKLRRQKSKAFQQ